MAPKVEAGGSALGRLDEIDVAKGLGILLVVLGHIVAIRREGPVDYAILKTYLYQFHMPLFMYLSGIAFALFCRKYGDRPFGGFVLSRANRLLVPFAVFGLMIAFIKNAASKVVHVDNATSKVVQAGHGSRLVDSIEAMFLHTSASPVLSIWYLWVLFIFSVVTFAFRLYLPRRLPWVIVVALVLYPLPLTDNFYLDRVSGYYVFFCLGMAASLFYPRLRAFLLVNIQWLGVAFVIASAVAIVLNDNNKAIMLSMSLVALPFIHAFALWVSGRWRAWLEFVGRYSMAIYLMNTLIIGIVKTVHVKIFGAMNSAFLLYALAAFVCGVIVPIFLARLAQRISPPVGRYLV